MSRTRSPFIATLGLIAFGAVLGGCGLRSVPLVETVGSSGDESSASSSGGFASTQVGDDADVGGGSDPDVGDGGLGEGRLGSCSNPYPLTSDSRRVSGSLLGPGLYRGWCGSDAGSENVYWLTPDYTTDVTIAFRSDETDFLPTVRVEVDQCGSGSDATRVCYREPFEDGFVDRRHFLAEAGRSYAITVDSSDGSQGQYAFDLIPGEAPLYQCRLHDEVIYFDPGGGFIWQNELSPGQGRADTQCGRGSPGRENIFEFVVDRPGWMQVFIEAGFTPSFSLRSGCGASTEVNCIAAERGEFATAQEVYIDEPGEWLIVVDQEGVDGGWYTMELYFSD